MRSIISRSDYRFGVEWAHELEEGIVDNFDELSGMEIIPENFLTGLFDSFLDRLAEAEIPVAVHGVLLSMGSMEPLNVAHLDRVLEVGRRVNMLNFSEHLSLTSAGGLDLDALTPLAFTHDVVDEVCRKVDQIQSRLEVPFLLENVSNRFVIPGSDFSEPEFINRILERTGCGLLLDVANVYANSVNFKFDPYAWLDEIRMESVQLIHLAGGYYDPDGFLMDSHDNAVAKETWALYRYALSRTPPVMTVIERTGSFPRFDVLLKELTRAKNTVLKLQRERNLPRQTNGRSAAIARI